MSNVVHTEVMEAHANHLLVMIEDFVAETGSQWGRAILEEFDADGDGKLSGEERKNAAAARKNRDKRQGRGPGDRPAVEDPGNAPQ